MPGGLARPHPFVVSCTVGPYSVMTLNLHRAATMPLRRPHVIALLLILLTTFDLGAATAARRKRRTVRKKAAVAAAPVETASGATLGERLASLVNGATARVSDTSIQIVDLE